ncbi:hypothetical protein C0993_005318 [Termitomyces sp. T159_Od127]|nr:hypothetical protein C0993_005318 [Termitomyces sp. T159_Od127]
MALPQATQHIIPVMALLNAYSNQPDPITEAEKEVEEALKQLQSTSVLQRQNRMTICWKLNPLGPISHIYLSQILVALDFNTIEALLNPAEEVHHMEQASDNDVCQAVLEAQEAWENMVQPTRHEVLQAASLLKAMLTIWRILLSVI